MITHALKKLSKETAFYNSLKIITMFKKLEINSLNILFFSIYCTQHIIRKSSMIY